MNNQQINKTGGDDEKHEFADASMWSIPAGSGYLAEIRRADTHAPNADDKASEVASRRVKSNKKDIIPHSMNLWNFLKDFSHLSEKEKQKKISVYHYSLRRAKKLTKENGLPLESNFNTVVDEQKNDLKSMYYHGLSEQQRQYLFMNASRGTASYYGPQMQVSQYSDYPASGLYQAFSTKDANHAFSKTSSMMESMTGLPYQSMPPPPGLSQTLENTQKY